MAARWGWHSLPCRPESRSPIQRKKSNAHDGECRRQLYPYFSLHLDDLYPPRPPNGRIGYPAFLSRSVDHINPFSNTTPFIRLLINSQSTLSHASASCRSCFALVFFCYFLFFFFANFQGMDGLEGWMVCLVSSCTVTSRLACIACNAAFRLPVRYCQGCTRACIDPRLSYYLTTHYSVLISL